MLTDFKENKHYIDYFFKNHRLFFCDSLPWEFYNYENKVKESAIIAPMSGYAIAKRSGEIYLSNFSKENTFERVFKLSLLKRKKSKKKKIIEKLFVIE